MDTERMSNPPRGLAGVWGPTPTPHGGAAWESRVGNTPGPEESCIFLKAKTPHQMFVLKKAGCLCPSIDSSCSWTLS